MYRISKFCIIINCKNVVQKQCCYKTRSHHTTTVRLKENIQQINTEIGSAYNPAEIENKTDQEYFLPPINKSLKPFSIILPPPNITGSLHLGHALTVTVQDVLVRWHRMRGHETFWKPGIDHAGIATQVVVEKKLWKEKQQTRHDLGRSRFEKEIWKWKSEKENVIINQLRGLAISLDWPATGRAPFTMDAGHSEAVRHAFITLHDEGMIYRADHLVNWSCRLQSAVSDMEVDHQQVTGPTAISVPGYDKPVEFGVLTEFAYKVMDSDEEIVVATTRPETIPGDVAVAVHPKDGRYTQLVGKQLWHPFRKEVIPVISDDFVDPNFGTGAVKLTPGHDQDDFATAHRHHLPILPTIDTLGHLTEHCPVPFAHMRRFDARPAVLSALANLQLLRGRTPHTHTVPLCSRSADVIELLVRPQWFLRCGDMAQVALDAVREGLLRIEPAAAFEKVWYNWLENIRDWCISRQLWWGHRIPAYFCTSAYFPDGSKTSCWVASEDADSARVKAAVTLNLPPEQITCTQDEDVLDTWFSSALLPFTAHGWPQKSKNFNKYYPLTVMETGHDILFFWVARMVMLGTHLTGDLPFDQVLLHGVICDAHGRKMSKSVGNVIAPEDVIRGSSLSNLEDSSKVSHDLGILNKDELKSAIKIQKKMFPQGIPQCGADALRFTLCSHNIKSHFINFDVQECQTNKFFGNKIWQATKFTLKWLEAVQEVQPLLPPFRCRETSYFPLELEDIDKWILSRLSHMVDTVNSALEKSEFHTATSTLKNFLYYEFCDVYLEACKRGLQSPNSLQARSHSYTLFTCLDHALRALAPFMPTLAAHLHEALCQQYNLELEHLSYPQDLPWRQTTLECDIDRVLETVVCIRRLKKMFNVTAKHKPFVTLTTTNAIFSNYTGLIGDLSGCDRLEIQITDNIMLDDNDAANANSLITSAGNSRLVESSANANDVVEVPKETTGGISVTDTAGGGEVTVRLHLSEEVRRQIKTSVDVDQLAKKHGKLTADLARLRAQIVADGYRQKVDESTHSGNLKKIKILEEKISRIDFMKRFSSQINCL